MVDIEITYWNMLMDVPETTFDMEVSERDFERLMDADDEGEFLDQEYMSENQPRLHRKILKAIRNNMEEEALLNPYDGYVEPKIKGPLSPPNKVYDYSSSHAYMKAMSDDDEIEYTINID